MGPELKPDQILLTVDEIETRKPKPHCFWELPTARIVSADGERYLSSVGATLLAHLLVMLMLALGTRCSLLLIADGARWIRAFFTDTLAHIADKTMIRDW